MARYHFDIKGDPRVDMALRVLNLFLVSGMDFASASITRDPDRCTLRVEVDDAALDAIEAIANRCRGVVMVHDVRWNSLDRESRIL